MAVLSDPGSLFERLMVLSHEAFDATHYSTAYHVLAAALHEAPSSHRPRVATERGNADEFRDLAPREAPELR